MRKVTLLVLALLLPVMVFVFLHYFGKNEFVVPVFYETPTDTIPSGCKIDQYPYQVRSSKTEIRDVTVVFFASGLTVDEYTDAMFQLSRLENEFREDAPTLVTFGRMDVDPDNQNKLLANADYEHEQKCVFLVGANRIVLVDANRYIRGLYKDASLKEIDRLILELKIIKKQY